MTTTTTNTTTTTTPLSIMTYNIYMDGYQNPQTSTSTLQSMLQSNIDILCLQECNQPWQDFIEQHTQLVSTYPHRYFHHDMGKYGGRAVLSKHKIIKKHWCPRVFRWWYGALLVSIEVPTTSSQGQGQGQSVVVDVLIVHLRAPFPSNPWHVQRQRKEEMEAHYNCALQTLKQRYQQPNSHNQQSDNPDNVNEEYCTKRLVILGDFNNASGPSHQYLTQIGFRNALQSFKAFKKKQQKDKSTTTLSSLIWNCAPMSTDISWHYGDYLGFLFDHLYFKPEGLVLQRAEICKVGGSDHWPLVASFEIVV